MSTNCRSEEQNTLPMVVSVTANVSDSFEREAKDTGGDGFIAKPLFSLL
jgi:CheY-like chemotaxis protein